MCCHPYFSKPCIHWLPFQLELMADRNGGFMRLLGLELATPESGEQGPKCQRFGAIVEDGILIKLVRLWRLGCSWVLIRAYAMASSSILKAP